MITIMLVDDHDLVRTGVKRLLEDDGEFTIVAEATSGEEALQLLRETDPQVVLMDINMPGIGGLEATPKLLRQKARSEDHRGFHAHRRAVSPTGAKGGRHGLSYQGLPHR